jgi:hypothetical protein
LLDAAVAAAADAAAALSLGYQVLKSLERKTTLAANQPHVQLVRSNKRPPVAAQHSQPGLQGAGKSGVYGNCAHRNAAMNWGFWQNAKLRHWLQGMGLYMRVLLMRVFVMVPISCAVNF